MAHRDTVQNIVKLAAHCGQPRQRLTAHTRLKQARVRLLEQERRNERGEVCIAAALAEAVECPLHLPRTRVDRGQRAGHRIFCIVVGVNTDLVARDPRINYRLGDLIDLMGQRAAVGVT